jgi:DNA-binding response OmpR family regulator
MSGYVSQLDASGPAVPFIQKPFSPELLCAAVVALLEQSRALRARVRQQGRRASGERVASEALRARTEDALAAAVDLVAAARAMQTTRAKRRGAG